MNNFQLNNTSVYLGGQCQWDIILTHKDDELIIGGFQLTPISNNIPFNKMGEINILNDNHSYTLKKFCTTLKENLWNTNPCFDEHTRDKNYEITGYYDQSFGMGLKRSYSYQVYGKQYEFFQPLWLEHITDNQYLKFKFDVYSISSSGKKNIIDSKELSFKTNGNQFHDSFINYFNNWIKYLNIMGKGNNQVMFVDLQNGIVQIDGVSTLSGQRSGKISCDYISNNLLSNERPNIETDYILSTMFKNHNTITSQLFNFNFCVNPEDLLDPFLLTQMKGADISVDCQVSIITEQGQSTITIPFERRSLVSNYQYIEKDIYDSFLFMSDVKQATGSGGQGSGLFYKDYDTQYIDARTGKKIDKNVLNYLQDYQIENIKDKNKLTQPIVHWGYTSHLQDTFNLYGGYSPFVTFDDVQSPSPSDPSYKIGVYEIKQVNGATVPFPNIDYTDQNGALSWIYPKKIMYFDFNVSTIISKISDIFRNYLEPAGKNIKDYCMWSLKDSLLKEEAYDNFSNYTVTFVYLKDLPGRISNYETYFTTNSWEKIYSDYDQIGILICKQIKSNDFLIVTNSLSKLSLKNILDISIECNEDWNEFMSTINKAVIQYNNTYDFYGFGQEIEIGKDDLNNNCYYKSLSRKTFLYRKCGELSPCMLSDPDFNINYDYYQSIKNNDIIEIKRGYSDSDNVQSLRYSFEDCELGLGKSLVLLNELNYTIEKSSINPTPIEVFIKEKLSQTYGYDTSAQKQLIDYVYGLYDANFKYDYKDIDSLDTIKYNVKMILK